MAYMSRRKDLSGVQDSKHLNRSMNNGVWLSAISHRLNGTELYY